MTSDPRESTRDNLLPTPGTPRRPPNASQDRPESQRNERRTNPNDQPRATEVPLSSRDRLRLALASPGSLRHAMLLREVLGPPKALLGPDDTPGSI